MLGSAVYQHEPAIGICYVPSSWNLPPTHPTPLSCHRGWVLSFLHHTANFYWLSNFSCGNICISMLLSQFIQPSPSPTVSTGLFSMSASPLLPCRQVHQCHLSISCIWYSFLSFWLTLLCIIGFRFIYLIRTESMHSFLWLSNILFCVCTTTFLVRWFSGTLVHHLLGMLAFRIKSVFISLILRLCFDWPII